MSRAHVLAGLVSLLLAAASQSAANPIPPAAYGEPLEIACERERSVQDRYCGEEEADNPMVLAALEEPALAAGPEPVPLLPPDPARDPGREAYVPTGWLAATGPRWGIADFLSWPSFDRGSQLHELGLGRVRLIVPWNVMLDAVTLGLVETQLTLASAPSATQPGGYEILVSFQLARTPPADHLPSEREYASAIGDFIRWADERGFRIPYFTAWNEPNFRAQPTHRNPYRAGRFWRLLNRACRERRADPRGSCAAIAGDFEDEGFSRAYLDGYLRGMGFVNEEVVWAWHAHADAHSEAAIPRRLREFLALTGRLGSPVWITEVGGRLDAYGLDRANRDLARSLAWPRIPQFRDRLRRFYVYQYRQKDPRDRWDSGLVSFDGALRPLYATYANRTRGPAG